VGLTPGGSIDTAIGLASSGLDLIAPGAGQAAQVGIKEASRAIQYAGQVAATGVGGLMETFLPTGGSELANNSWLTRIAGGLAGASPALPNIAGGAAGQAQQNGEPPPPGPGAAPLTPEQIAAAGNKHGQNGGADPGPQQPITVNYTNQGATEDRAGADLSYHLSQSNGAGMGGMGKGR
jgi:hypothetical protein